MLKTIKKETIHAKGLDIGIYTSDYENEFISLTDIAKYKSTDPNDVIKNWMRSRETTTGRTRAGYCFNTPCVLLSAVWTS